MRKGPKVPKWVLINRPRIPKMPRNLSDQIVCPWPKSLGFLWKKASSSVHSLCFHQMASVSIWQHLWVLKFLAGNMLLSAFSPLQPLFTCYFAFYFRRNELIMYNVHVWRATYYDIHLHGYYNLHNKWIINILRFSLI